MSVMTADKASSIIDAMEPFVPLTDQQAKTLETLKVDYSSVIQMPVSKARRLVTCCEWIRERFNISEIYLCMSQLDGYPIDEHTSLEQFEAKKAFGRSKFSDWDFIVPGLPVENHIEQIAPLIKVDLFRTHHNDVRKLRVYA